MCQRVVGYVASVCLLAVVGSVGVMVLTGSAEPLGIAPAICFAALGVFTQAFGHDIGKGAQGNISFIPFLSAALLSPTVSTIIILACAVLSVELSARRSPLKATFNVAQYVLALSFAVITYRMVGGVPFLVQPAVFTHVSQQPASVFLPSVALVLVFLGLNSLAVSGAIAISESKNLWRIWRAHTCRAAMYDVLSLPFVLMFVGVYTIWGTIGAVLLAAPLLTVRQLYKTNWQLERTNQDLLQLMVAAIEARDPYTSGHSKRVSAYARIVAEILGLSHREVERISTAALLHDVGKIHEVYAPILQKPGKLTPEERAIMETHPAKSAELISNVSYLHDLVQPVLHHHENWDGSGYPSGLAGAEIPQTSRIIMFADTIDAMTTDRPYRKALSEFDVRRELARFRGSQFDPMIVDTLLASSRFADLFASVATIRPSPVRPVSAVRWRIRRLTA